MVQNLKCCFGRETVKGELYTWLVVQYVADIRLHDAHSLERYSRVWVHLLKYLIHLKSIEFFSAFAMLFCDAVLVLFSIALEILWPSATCLHASSTSHVRGMRRHWGEVNTGLDTACKAIFPPLLGKGGHCRDVDEVMWPNANRRQDPCLNTFQSFPYNTMFCRTF